MDKSTLIYALQVLDVQFDANRKTEDRSLEHMRQSAYYDGMRRMLEMVLSEGYSDNVYVVREGGKHTVLA